MIDLAASHLLDASVLDLPGGFGWWYIDLVDENGDGVVVIWSYGLPFLPGLAGAARSGRPTSPRARPSLNISVYRGGKIDLYLLQEYDESEVSWDADAGLWRFGDTVIRRVQGSGPDGAAAQGRVRVELKLDCVLPASGERLQGRIEIQGATCQGAASPPVDAPHVWSPVTVAATGEVDLEAGPWRFRTKGRAYHDRNWGRRPLHDLGIRRWSWGRLAFSGREVIWYQLEPTGRDEPEERLVLEVSDTGAVQTAVDPVLSFGPGRLSPFGLRWPRWVRLMDVNRRAVHVDFVHKVDDSPFYQRFVVKGTCEGETAWGIAETVVPAKVDQAWMRPLVRMRVHRPGRGNSMWLPLFTGPRAGRTGRLLGQLTGGRTPALEAR